MTTTTNNQTRAAKAIQTTTLRGVTLFQDGYTLEAYADRRGVYSVVRPEGQPLTAGETLWNDVDVKAGTCTCEGFARRRTCKHIIAVNRIVAKVEQRITEITTPATVQPVRPAYGTPAWNKMASADFG